VKTDDARMVVFGETGHLRIAALQNALQRQDLHPAHAIGYDRWLSDPRSWAARLPAQLFANATSIAAKLDAPSVDRCFYDALAHRGRLALGCDASAATTSMHGELAYRQDWYAGFADLLRALERDIAQSFPVRWLNAPEEVLLMCDKWRCQRHLAAAGIDIPRLLGLIEGYDHLQQLLDDSGCDRVFLKARYGAAAAGVVAYQRHRDGRVVVVTTTEIDVVDGRTRLFNRLAPQRHTDRAQVAVLIDALAVQGCYAEAWVPKPRAPGHPGHHFDLRVIAFSGEPRQRAARIAAHPMTNLHLGNRRGDPAALLDAPTMRRVEETVRAAARAFPGSASIGFDVIPTRDRCVVVEANAFGDFVQHIHWQGADAYDDQARWVATARFRTTACPSHRVAAHG
jgi:glutathione synthase/RimK-type ligase-like ATP-grasp enzyme